MSNKTLTIVSVVLLAATAYLVYDKMQTNKALKAAGKKVSNGQLLAA